ncbi:MAG: hypothetical protein GY903_29015 [Fuerstiella sp.]|nr:hypothetical protein [Fuerstiella sp.]MCP4858537.1 hypothetical protein [Fuerstiella sp.]
MIRHVAGVAEIVEDVNEALKFYCDTLGLSLKERSGDDYAVILVPGVMHLGIWNRGHAAECTLGNRNMADQIPLGLTMEFEVDNVDETRKTVERTGRSVAQKPRLEPWGQKTCRMFSPAGSLLGFAETPWARRIATPLKVEEDSE